MNAKEVVLTAFQLGKPDRVPAVIYGGGVWTMAQSPHSFQHYIGKPEEMAELIIETNKKVESDMVFPGSGYNNFHSVALGGKIKFPKMGAPELEEAIIQSPADLEKLDPAKLKENETVQTVRQATKIVQEKIGAQHLVATTSWGPFTLAGQFFGPEKMMKGLVKQKEFMTEIMALATEVIFEFYRPMVEGGYLEAVALADPTASGDLISKKQFEQFAVPFLHRLNTKLRKIGAKSFVHICGDTTDRLELMLETGADCIALDQKVDMSKIAGVLGGKMCYAGNLNPVVYLNNGTKEQIITATEECLAKAKPQNGGYVLLPGCDIPPTVPLDNINTFLQTGRHYQI
jgi:uroporphyrinogen decarboxylase